MTKHNHSICNKNVLPQHWKEPFIVPIHKRGHKA